VIVSCTSPVPGGRIQDEDVELAPLDVPQELGDELRHHRAAPDDGCRVAEEHPHRDDAQAVLLHRDDAAVLARRAFSSMPSMSGTLGP
jgi:hypothetical protein